MVLSSGHIGMQDIFKEYQQWSDEDVVTEINLPQYTTAVKMLDKLLPCETSLVSNLPTVLLVYVVMTTGSTRQCRSLPVILSCC